VADALPGGTPRLFGGVVGSGVLHVSGRRIVCVRSDDRTKRVPVVPYMAEPTAWNAVMDALSEA
jgi:hypothetical protein